MQETLREEAIAPEAAYRIRKLLERTFPLTNKLFVKTLKGKEMITHCVRKTLVVRSHLTDPDDHLYRLLTDLEKSYESLLKKTYEFRVKAG